MKIPGFTVWARLASVGVGERVADSGDDLLIVMTPDSLIALQEALGSYGVLSLAKVLHEMEVVDTPSGRVAGVFGWGRQWLIDRGVPVRGAKRAVADLEDLQMVVSMKQLDEAGEPVITGKKWGVIGPDVLDASTDLDERLLRTDGRRSGAFHRPKPALEHFVPTEPTRPLEQNVPTAPTDSTIPLAQNVPTGPSSVVSMGETPVATVLYQRDQRGSTRGREEKDTKTSLLAEDQINPTLVGALFGSREVSEVLADASRLAAFQSTIRTLDEQRAWELLYQASPGAFVSGWLEKFLTAMVTTPAAAQADACVRLLADAGVTLKRPVSAEQLAGGLFLAIVGYAATRNQKRSNPDWLAWMILNDAVKPVKATQTVLQALTGTLPPGQVPGTGVPQHVGRGGPPVLVDDAPAPAAAVDDVFGRVRERLAALPAHVAEALNEDADGYADRVGATTEGPRRDLFRMNWLDQRLATLTPDQVNEITDRCALASDDDDLLGHVNPAPRTVGNTVEEGSA